MMDFFDHQDRARRNTGRLVVLFALAVIGTVIATYVVVAIFTAGVQGYTESRQGGGAVEVFGGDWARTLLRWDLLLYVGLGVLAVVGGGSLFKLAQLAGGGHIVAQHMGGRPISPNTTDPAERRVLNVVEEMAIASGTPVPPVFILEESGINAFAAGYSPSDAVIGVTRGCVESLNRDQLQGVMAHEFSHILNGDMRLNIRLIGVLHGILIVGMIGYFVFRIALNAGSHRSSKKGNPLPLIALGAALMAVGFIGTFFGNLIKAAVSRQREFLADASAVQFTRNPDGIAGALKVIGRFMPGQQLDGAAKVLHGDWKRSWIAHPHAPEASHMFFAEGLASLFATHPPLAERIKRIDPSFEGAPLAASRITDRQAASSAGVSSLVGSAGQPTEAHIARAHDILGSLPAALADAAHDPVGAESLVYAMLLDPDPRARERQASRLGSDALNHVMAIVPAVERLDRASRLPLIELAIGSLRGLSPQQYEAFGAQVKALVETDEKISVFEWVLQRIVLDHLDAHFGRRPPARVVYHSLKPVQPHVAVLLSALAYAGHASAEQAARAFAAARRYIDTVTLLSPQECSLDRLDAAVRELSGVTPQIKRRVLTAAAACIAADRQVTPGEAELFRAVADALGVPVPPLLPGQAMV